MACPFFQPVKRLDATAWDPPPRLPLGAAWSGFCLAHPSGSFEPPESVQWELCNCGYARGRCAHFPAESSAAQNPAGLKRSEPATVADAVRFAAIDVHEDADKAAHNDAPRIMYIFEKDHAPVAFGEFHESEHSPAVVAQARAFLERIRSQG